eukprot:TRINITY_DN1249_c0_g1_i1.p1 TRINITY_DN1249_c0_g1~~TRINITY_DN1249_c0_g1_i1.p1  ORF type:complete len:158 (-),score=41.49 TRINITY_DN1249_c0_g1_i1:61-534(-)
MRKTQLYAKHGLHPLVHLSTMLIPKKTRVAVFSYLFKEGVLVAKKDTHIKHNEIDVPNLYVIKLMQSLKSRNYVNESFTWNHYYWYLTNEGINYLREFLHLPEEIVPATLKKKASTATTQRAGAGGRGAGRRGFDSAEGEAVADKPQGLGRGRVGGQ